MKIRVLEGQLKKADEDLRKERDCVTKVEDDLRKEREKREDEK